MRQARNNKLHGAARRDDTYAHIHIFHDIIRHRYVYVYTYSAFQGFCSPIQTPPTKTCINDANQAPLASSSSSSSSSSSTTTTTTTTGTSTSTSTSTSASASASASTCTGSSII